MRYISGAIVIVVLVILSGFASGTARRKKRLQQLRERWGKPKMDEYSSQEQISMYAKLDTDPCFHELSAQTMTDLDFDLLFSFADRTVCRVGQQYFYNKLKKPSNDEAYLRDLDAKAGFFTANKPAREKVQEILSGLSSDNSYYIASLFTQQLLKRPKWFGFLVIDTLAVIAMLLLSPRYPVLLIWMMIPFALNMGLHFWNKNNIYLFIRSLPQLGKLLTVSKELAALQIPFDNTRAKQSIGALRNFQRKMSLVSFGQQGMAGDLSQLYLYFIETIKSLFLVELHAFYSIIRELENKQQDVRNVFDYAGSVDMCLSIASLRSGAGAFCRPVFIPASKKMQVKQICHPLITGCVPNDLALDRKSILITGSNMSGKTTFLRTVAINSILAQTIYTCFAGQFEMPFVKHYSSIRIDDSLLDGKSYYLEEVDLMGRLIAEVKPGQQNLFVLDEVFKGTNTVERIAAGKAILSYLDHYENIVMVSTHDIEMAGLLSDRFELCHFAETIQNNELVFDHLLKPGELKIRNAIRILAMAGYPEEIVAEAERLSVINN